MKKSHVIRISGVTTLVALLVFTIAAWPLVGRDDSGDLQLFPGLALSQPALAITADEFPDTNIGFSAYFKTEQVLDLDNLPRELFSDVKFAGDNFVIGTNTSGNTFRFNSSSLGKVEVHIYADNQGWIMAYYPNPILVSEAIRCCSVHETNLANVIQQAAAVAGVTISDEELLSGIGYYHWRYPTATHLTMSVKRGGGPLYFAIPEAAILREASTAFMCENASGSMSIFDTTYGCNSTGGLVQGGVASVPLIGSAQVGRGIETDGTVRYSQIAKPSALSEGGPSVGDVHRINVSPNNIYWLTLALLYEIESS